MCSNHRSAHWAPPAEDGGRACTSVGKLASPFFTRCVVGMGSWPCLVDPVCQRRRSMARVNPPALPHRLSRGLGSEDQQRALEDEGLGIPCRRKHPKQGGGREVKAPLPPSLGGGRSLHKKYSKDEAQGLLELLGTLFSSTFPPSPGIPPLSTLKRRGRGPVCHGMPRGGPTPGRGVGSDRRVVPRPGPPPLGCP